jgi:hypothetical protein
MRMKLRFVYVRADIQRAWVKVHTCFLCVHCVYVCMYVCAHAMHKDTQGVPAPSPPSHLHIHISLGQLVHHG